MFKLLYRPRDTGTSTSGTGLFVVNGFGGRCQSFGLCGNGIALRFLTSVKQVTEYFVNKLEHMRGLSV